MGLCRYCQTKAGIFKNAHDACTRRAVDALNQLTSLATNAVAAGLTAVEITPVIKELKQKGRVTDRDATLALLQGADKAALALAHEQPVSNEEFERIGDIFSTIDKSWLDDASKLIAWQGYVSLNFSNSLYQVLHGEIPYFPPISLSFILTKDEHPIIKRNTILAEYKTVSTGLHYQSVSLPVGHGVYYRIGALAPRTQHSELVPIDEGEMLITTQAIYFGGTKTTFRLPFASILRIESFADGVGVYENHGSGKLFIPGTLGFDDGWFFYNLISALTAQVS